MPAVTSHALVSTGASSVYLRGFRADGTNVQSLLDEQATGGRSR